MICMYGTLNISIFISKIVKIVSLIIVLLYSYSKKYETEVIFTKTEMNGIFFFLKKLFPLIFNTHTHTLNLLFQKVFHWSNSFDTPSHHSIPPILSPPPNCCHT